MSWDTYEGRDIVVYPFPSLDGAREFYERCLPTMVREGHNPQGFQIGTGEEVSEERGTFCLDPSEFPDSLEVGEFITLSIEMPRGLALVENRRILNDLLLMKETGDISDELRRKIEPARNEKIRHEDEVFAPVPDNKWEKTKHEMYLLVPFVAFMLGVLLMVLIGNF